MAVKQQYNIVGKYINDNDARDVVGYHLRNLDGTKQGKYSIEQVAFLVGRDQVLNCTAQLYKDKVLFRGKGISLESLPTQRINVNKKAEDKTEIKMVNTKKQVKSINKIEDKTEIKITNNKIEDKTLVKEITGDELYKMLQEVISKHHLVGAEYATLNREDWSYGPFLCVSLTLEGEDEDSNLYGEQYKYLIDASNPDYYYLRQTDLLNDYIMKSSIKSGLEKFIVEALKFLGYCNNKEVITNVYNNIPINSADAFENYSGYWGNITAVLQGDTNIDEDCVIETFMDTLFMVMGYEIIQGTNTVSTPLFRGDGRTVQQLECINNTFMSFSTLCSIAGKFAGKSGCVVFVESAPMKSLMDIHNIAVMGEEHEVLVNIGNEISILEEVGKIDGVPIYKAKLERALNYKSTLKYIVNKYTKYINESLFFYTLCKLMMQIKDINQVDFVCNDLTITNDDVWIKLDTDDYLNNTNCFEVELSNNSSLTIETKEDIKLLLEYLNKAQ